MTTCVQVCMLVSARLPSSGPGHHHRDDKLHRRGKNWGGVLCCNCSSPPRGDGPTGGGNTPPRGDQKKMAHLCATRHPESTRQRNCTSLHPPLPLPQGSCCDCNKNPPPRQICFVSRRILHHEPGSCYCLRQAPASSLNFAMFR